MGGELGINILSVYSNKTFVRPESYDFVSSIEEKDNKPCNDLSIRGEDGSFFHICGNNDWAFLALDLLKPITDEAKKIVENISEHKKVNPAIKAVVLGKNDKRIMDVYFGGKDKCNEILELPVVLTNLQNAVSFLVEYEPEIPFT